jgi:hypothetical protein
MNNDGKNPAPTGGRKSHKGPGGCCPWCGATEGLKSFIIHHPGGRANDPDLTIRLCPRCADRADGLLTKHNVNLKHDAERSLPDVVVAVLVGIALVLWEWVKRLFYWAARIDAFKDVLDRDYPGWRAMPEAQP